MNCTSLLREIGTVCPIQDTKMGGEAMLATTVGLFSHSTIVFHYVKHNISLDITSRDMLTPNCIC